MHARIVVVGSSASGILASVMVSIRKAGVNVEKQHSEDKGEQQEMSFDVFATKEELVEIKKNILGLASIDDVKLYSLKAKPGAAEESSQSDGNNTALRISQVYPNIVDIVNEHIDTLDKQEAPDLLREIGREVAILRKDKILLHEKNPDLISLVESSVVKELDGIADCEYAREGFETGLKIVVSEFTKPRKAGGAMALDSFGTLGNSTIKCDFLSGYIEGAVRLLMDSEKIEVVETRCRNEGHPYCLFEFNQG